MTMTSVMFARRSASALALACSAGVAAAGDGSAWIHYPAPSPGRAFNTLYDVAGAGWDNVWAVGRADDQAGSTSPRSKTLAVHWDGSAWTQFATPNPGVLFDFNELHGVAALAPNEVIAVGSYRPDSGGPAQTLTLRFDGTAWASVPSLDLPGGSEFRSAAVCTKFGSDSDVWAVGMRSSESGDGSTRPLAARWTGSGWQEFPVPIRGDSADSRNEFKGIAGSEPLIWAVGRVQRTVSGPYVPLIQSWNGSEWRIAIDDTTELGGAALEAVAVAALDRAVAVGRRVDVIMGGMDQPYIMMWNGANWRAATLAPLTDGPAELTAVAARSVVDIWASGVYTTGEGERLPLLYHFDGETWTRSDAAATEGPGSAFRGMAAVPNLGGDIWAVGEYDAAADPRSLTQLRCAADLNGDGLVDFGDYLEFLNLFEVMDQRADFTGDDGIVDFSDYLEFLNRYETGC